MTVSPTARRGSPALRLAVFSSPVALELYYAATRFSRLPALFIAMCCAAATVLFAHFSLGLLSPDGEFPPELDARDDERRGLLGPEGLGLEKDPVLHRDSPREAPAVDTDLHWCQPCQRHSRPGEEHCAGCGRCVWGRFWHCEVLCCCVGPSNIQQYMALLCCCALGSALQAEQVLDWAFTTATPEVLAAVGGVHSAGAVGSVCWQLAGAAGAVWLAGFGPVVSVGYTAKALSQLHSRNLLGHIGLGNFRFRIESNMGSGGGSRALGV